MEKQKLSNRLTTVREGPHNFIWKSMNGPMMIYYCVLITTVRYVRWSSFNLRHLRL